MKSLEKYILAIVLGVAAAISAGMGYNSPDIKVLTGVSQLGPKGKPVEPNTSALPYEPNNAYALISINQDASKHLLLATIGEESRKKIIEVAKFKDGKWDSVLVGGPTGNSSTPTTQ